MFKFSNYEKILFSVPDISPIKILRIHGYKNKNKIKPKIFEAANKAIERLFYNSSPEGFFFATKIKKRSSNNIILQCGTILNCEIFNERLPKSNYLVVFILTLGKGIDDELRKISDELDEPLGAIFLENASWLALELIIREARLKVIKFAYSKNLEIENRMAPGNYYPSKKLKKRIIWNLEEQLLLFKLFDQNMISLSLTDSFTMIPRMSRSGIFGLKNKSSII